MIHLIDEKNKRVFCKLKNSIVGGPSIVCHRYHEKGVTKITKVHYNQKPKEWYYSDDGKDVKTIVGYDANSLYLYCVGRDMLCGKLELIPTEEEYLIEYENETMGLDDHKKNKYIADRQLNKSAKTLQETLDATMNNNRWLTFLELFFGAIEADIKLSEDKYEIFAEMPPIFKDLVYSEEETGPYMTNVMLGLKQKFSKTRKLIASLKATKVLLLSVYLKWLVEKGVVISKVYGVTPPERAAPFEGFVEWVSKERRKGDRDTQCAIIGEAAKTVGNSAYGRTGMNKNKFQKIKYSKEQQFNRAKNDYFYYDAEEYDGMYEVTKNTKTVLQNIPIQVAFNVLNYAKLRLLEFYYDCVSKYLDTTDFQYVYMDTDSAYMALTDKFENLIKPELRDEYETDKNN